MEVKGQRERSGRSLEFMMRLESRFRLSEETTDEKELIKILEVQIGLETNLQVNKWMGTPAVTR